VEPEFTELAREASFQGTVLISIVVDVEGHPTNPKVLKPVGFGLDDEALSAVQQWRFKPGMKDGQPVPVFAQIEMAFRLLGGSPSDVAAMRADAENGKSWAQARLGKAYYWGNGVDQDYLEALRLFSLAAANDDPTAESYLGIMFSKGQGVGQDYSEAASWLVRAAEQGNVIAQLNLGIAYEESAGLRQDYVQAFKWFDLAAAKNIAQAVRLRTELGAKMTPSEIASAQALVKEWRPSPSRGVQ